MLQAQIDRDYESFSKYAVNVATSTPGMREPSFEPTDSSWDCDRLADVAAYLADRVAPAARILDAGCSSGTFLRLLRDKGFGDVLGLDPSPDAVARAIGKNDVRAITGSFTSPPGDLGTFDVVTLSHTLEHITDVRRAIASLHALLRDEGRAYVEVPDAERYDRYLVAPFHDFNTEHINHFSLGVLRQLMDSSGFEELESGSKIVYCSPVDKYPAIYGLWRKRAQNCTHKPFERDESLVRAAKRYVVASQERMDRIDRDLRDALAVHPNIILWGAGQLAMKLLCDTVLAERNVVAIVDSSPQRHGMHVGDTEIVPPTVLRDLPPYPIVIASIHSDAAIADTIDRRYCLPNPTVRLYRAPANAAQ